MVNGVEKALHSDVRFGSKADMKIGGKMSAQCQKQTFLQHENPKLRGSQLVFDVLDEPLGAGVLELSLRDVSAPVFVNLFEVDDERRGG